MNNGETFTELLQVEVTQAPVLGVVLNLFLAAIGAFCIARAYVRYGTSLSNRQAFARNFVLLTMTTALTIAVIEPAPILSLGMIGALSIVRFRSAIKEPEELCYLFLAIATGLGFGASQRFITIGGLVAILLTVRLKHRLDGRTKSHEQNMYLTVVTRNPAKVNMETIGNLLKEACTLHRLKRLDQSKESTEACFLVEPKTSESLQSFEAQLRQVDDAVVVSLLDFRGGMMGMP